MGCCGKAKNIATGAIKHFAPAGMFDDTVPEKRKELCRQCDKQTWMVWSEYLQWLSQLGIIDLAKNMDKLDTLPPLPIKPKEDNAKWLCSICKCFIPLKIQVEDETCPLKKW